MLLALAPTHQMDPLLLLSDVISLRLHLLLQLIFLEVKNKPQLLQLLVLLLQASNGPVLHEHEKHGGILKEACTGNAPHAHSGTVTDGRGLRSDFDLFLKTCH